MKISALLAAALCAVSLPAAAQNLLANPSFDVDLSGWSTSGSIAPAWDATDIDDSSSSGSALISNGESTSTSEEIVLTQCHEIGPGEYPFGLHAFIPSGQGVTGSVVVRILGYSQTTNCTGGVFASSGRLATELDTWQRIDGTLSVTAGQLANPTGSIEFIVAIRKSEDFGRLDAFVDEAFFGRGPIIFSDRFETP